jgi:uncharacterized iron-regulated protein
MNTSITVNATANEGGAWGMAVCAMYMTQITNYKLQCTNQVKSSPSFEEGVARSDGVVEKNLENYLNKVFADAECMTIEPDKSDVEGFEKFIDRYAKGLAVVRNAVEVFKIC